MLSRPFGVLILTVLAMAVTVATLAQDVKAEPLASYTFSGNTKDDSGQSRHATNHGATFVGDRFGNANSACYLNGTNSYVALPSSFPITADFAVSFWLQTTVSIADSWPWAYFIVDRDICYANLDWSIGLGEGGKILFNTGGNDQKDYTLGSNKAVNDGAWHHVVCMRRGKEKTIFIDGKQDGTSQFGFPSYRNTSLSIYLGASVCNTSSHRFFVGAIDDVCVYGRALEAVEIASLYSSSPDCDARASLATEDYIRLGYYDFLFADPEVQKEFSLHISSSRTQTLEERIYWDFVNNGVRKGGYFMKPKPSVDRALADLKEADLKEDKDICSFNDYMSRKDINLEVDPFCPDAPVLSSSLTAFDYADAIIALAILKGRIQFKNEYVGYDIKAHYMTGAHGKTMSVPEIRIRPYECFLKNINMQMTRLLNGDKSRTVSDEEVDVISQAELERLKTHARNVGLFVPFVESLIAPDGVITKMDWSPEDDNGNQVNSAKASSIKWVMNGYFVLLAASLELTRLTSLEDRCNKIMKKVFGEISPIPYSQQPKFYCYCSQTTSPLFSESLDAELVNAPETGAVRN